MVISSRKRPLWRFFIVFFAILISAVGCTPSQALPTLAVLPTQKPVNTPLPPSAVPVALASTSSPTQAPPSQTPSITPTVTPSPTITETPTITRTSTPTSTPTLAFTPTPETDAVVANAEGVNLRSGPHIAFEPPIALIEDGTPLTLIAISPNLLWYKVTTGDGQQGWAYSKLLKIYREPPGLPVVNVPFPTSVPVVSVVQAPLNIPSIGGGGIVPLPIPSSGGGGAVSARVAQIYQQGLAMGNNPHMFAKVGDSITSNQSFMIGYGSSQYNLGGFTSLQESINYFSADAFTRTSIAAKPGFNAAAVMDPIWSPQGTCQLNESPLMCEYRLTRPSVAIILIGSVDVQLYDANAFNGYLSQIVNLTIGQGIVPVLTTFTYASDYYPAQSEAFNGVIRSIAASQQIPLIDLQGATANMPGRGVGGDKFHLTQRSDDWINLTGDENQYGSTMRNLITLQTLDSLRRGLGMG
jgi:hypothetical protein